MGGINSLVALIICNAVKHFAVCPAVVLTVDDLAHKPEIGAKLAGKAVYSLYKVLGKAVGSVEADTVDTPFLYPHFYRAENVFNHVIVVKVQLYEIVVTVPALVGEIIAVR